MLCILFKNGSIIKLSCEGWTGWSITQDEYGQVVKINITPKEKNPLYYINLKEILCVYEEGNVALKR